MDVKLILTYSNFRSCFKKIVADDEKPYCTYFFKD